MTASRTILRAGAKAALPTRPTSRPASARELRYPPGPRLPAVAQGAMFVFGQQRFFERCRARYGPTFSLRVPTLPPIVVFSDESSVREIFSCRPEDVSVGAALDWMHPFVGRGSLLLKDGEPHRRERRLLMPPFHHSRMASYGVAIRDIARDAMRAWPLDRPFAIEPAARSITLDIILHTVFGVDGSEREELRRALMDLFEDFSVFNLVPALRADLGTLTPWGRFLAHRATLDRLLLRLICQRRRERDAERDDVLAMLLDARHEDGSPMRDEELRDELVTLVSAGHETSTAALAWAFQCLAHHPEAQARASAELESAPDRLEGLGWMDAVVKETLRRHAVFPLVARVLVRPQTIGGWALPEGTLVYVSIHLTHRNPSLWPEPERFDPSRFLDAAPRPFAFVPFGGGSRRCIGKAYALFEMRLIVAEALRRFRIVSTGAPEAAVSRGFTLAPANGAVVRLHARHPARAGRRHRGLHVAHGGEASPERAGSNFGGSHVDA